MISVNVKVDIPLVLEGHVKICGRATLESTKVKGRKVCVHWGPLSSPQTCIPVSGHCTEPGWRNILEIEWNSKKLIVTLLVWILKLPKQWKKFNTKSMQWWRFFFNDSFIEMFFEIEHGEIKKLRLPCKLKMLGSLEYMTN